ncbi:MAG TPA: deoxyhypusine synthase family protein, partial [Candidatus Paceibacterota bacterium]
MKTKSRSSKLKLEPLIPLDLKKCRTVSEIVGGMSHCAFGARMLGEVCAMLFDWTNRNGKPYVIRDHLDLANEKLLGVMYQHGWFQGPYTSLEFIDHCRRAGFKERKALVLGNYHEGTADELYRCANEAIFVNQHGFARPGQIQDGFFPNAVFIDPNLALPIFFAVLKERKGFGKVSVPELFLRLKQHAGLAHDLVAGGETLLAMYRDKHCVRFLTLAGAMTIAKMQLLICDMIDNCLVDHISSTGALMAHGLIEGIGDRHYKHNPENDDKLLAARGINRVTDSLEPETNFDHLDDVMDGVLDGFTGTRDIAPSEIHARIGQYLREHHPTCRGVLRSAYDKRVPVCVPAFVDSEIGNDV